MSLYNKIKYGNSDKPKFIVKKSKWLCNGKWITQDAAYSKLGIHEFPLYTYKIKGELFGTYNFDKVVDDTTHNALEIEFTDYNQFSMYQFKLLTTIIENAAKNKIAKFTHIFR